MNRKILFRAWNNTVKQMKQIDQIFFDKKEIIIHDESCSPNNKIWLFTDCYIMQFTNSLDDEEQMIFEGDILHCTAEENYSFRTGNWICRFSTESSFLLQEMRYFKEYTDCNFGLPVTWLGFEKKQVIGNIYQNKELLL